MKIRCVFCMVLLCLAAGLVSAPGAPLSQDSAAPFAVGIDAVQPSVSGCFPVDECNICCPIGGGKLICTQRACV